MKIKNKFIHNKIKSKKIKKKIKNKNTNIFTVYRTSRHIYAKILSVDKSKIEVYASTTEKKILKLLIDKKIYTGNRKSAEIIGEIIAKRAIEKNIKKVIFNRSRFKFHGRIKSLANSSRNNGLIF
ncbi:50S ribosomal protein L18 [endosymbiont of Euscepes postfasciatus]|uniref:50S ribosomal protein L18 n=1 Tax=endosymbiont of Euscepes postfasciatus TaxID=650377 RepID=UPI000DC72E82|nr:50S ribosomal protein L18 [endosymbiont of Euscepes postfasciatus]BBA84677.1 50S ribosomal protein L18 [endosymbiont of Euscepes postfasciatus]